MPAPTLKIHAFAVAGRLTILAQVRQVLGRFGWIVDFYNFAHASTTIHFEIQPPKIAPLLEELRSIDGLKVWVVGDDVVINADAPEEVAGTLDVVYSNDGLN